MELYVLNFNKYKKKKKIQIVQIRKDERSRSVDPQFSHKLLFYPGAAEPGGGEMGACAPPTFFKSEKSALFSGLKCLILKNEKSIS
jgi:hypothetical protein